MAAADARRLHRARGGKVGRTQAHAVHARRRRRDRGDVVDALRSLEDGVHENGLLRPCRASSSARYWSTKWMSQSPSTLGIITTSSLSPISPTSRVMSSRNQGEFSALTRTHKPGRAEIGRLRHGDQAFARGGLGFDGIASSRLPSTTSTWPASSPPWRAVSRCAAARNGSSARAGTAVREGGAARRSRAARNICAELSSAATGLRL